MKHRVLLSLCLNLFLLYGVGAQPFPSVEPSEAGFSPGRLALIDSLIQSHIDRNEIAGVVTLIARDGRAVHHKSFGFRRIETGEPMTNDVIFRIASMSKAVTTVAVMLLYQEGKLLLTDPVSKYIPQFRNTVVAVPPPAGAPDTVSFVTAPAVRPITIHHLLTHTSGLTYGAGPAEKLYKEANLDDWYFADHDETIGEAVLRLASLPLAGQPGEGYLYGFSTDVLGYLVEVVSGMPLDRFFEERIFRPLGMSDTYFYLPREKANRLATVYGIDGNRHLAARETPETSDNLIGPRKAFSGGAGLVSTATDYGRFLQMLLNEGELDGVRLLAPKTVEIMHRNHVGDRYDSGKRGFGLGFWVLEDLGRYGEMGTKGAYGWGSAYYPQYWVDPQEDMIALFMTQLTPSGGLDLARKFYTLVYAALEETRSAPEK